MADNQMDDISAFANKWKERIRFPRLKFRLGTGVKILVAVVVLLLVCYNLFFVYVRPDEYGIKVVRVGLNRGVQKEVYHAGLTFVLPFGLQQMYRLPKGIQVLELTNFPEHVFPLWRPYIVTGVQNSKIIHGVFPLSISSFRRLADVWLI